MNQIEPAVTSVTQQYEAGRVAENEFAPRGGGRTAADVQSGSLETADISKLVADQFTKNQTEGATGLLDIEQLMTELTMGSASGASATLSNQATSLNDQQKTSAEVSANTGAGIGSLIALLAS
jgi:hypothetical protein